MCPRSTVFASYWPSSLYWSNPAIVGLNRSSRIYRDTIALKFISVILWKQLYHVRIVRTSSLSILQLGHTFQRSTIPSLIPVLSTIRPPPPLYFYFVLHYFHSSTYQIYCQTMSPVLGTPPSFYP